MINDGCQMSVWATKVVHMSHLVDNTEFNYKENVTGDSVLQKAVKKNNKMVTNLNQNQILYESKNKNTYLQGI